MATTQDRIGVRLDPEASRALSRWMRSSKENVTDSVGRGLRLLEGADQAVLDLALATAAVQGRKVGELLTEALRRELAAQGLVGLEAGE